MDKHHCLACDTVVEGLDQYILHKRQDCPAILLVRSTSHDASTTSMQNKDAPAEDRVRHPYQTVISATDSFQDGSSQEKNQAKEASDDTELLSTALDTNNLPTVDQRLPCTRSKSHRLYNIEGFPHMTTETKTGSECKESQKTESDRTVNMEGPSSLSDDICPYVDRERSTTDQCSKLKDEALKTSIETKPQEDEDKDKSTVNKHWCNVCKTYLSATALNRHLNSKRHKYQVSSVNNSNEKLDSCHSPPTDATVNGTKISSNDVQSEESASITAPKRICRQRRKRKLPSEGTPAKNNFRRKRNAQRSSNCLDKKIDSEQSDDSERQALQYYCSECPFRTAYKASLRRHFQTFHSLHLSGHCDKTFVTSEDCAAHQREVHGTTGRKHRTGHGCGDCDAQFSTEEDLNIHRRERRHMLYWGSTCVFCGKTVSKGPCLKGHIQAVHLGEKPHKCQHCSYSTAWVADLHMHVKRHLNIKPFKCPECDYTAVRMAAVKKHQQTHGEGESRRLCDICGKSFAGNLQRHMTLHEGHKPFECPHDGCTYASTFKQGLTDHVKSVHKADKSIVCEECGFATTTEKLMKWHKRRKHSAEKPHKCDQCNYATTWQPHLVRHKRTHTGEKPYNCPHCSYRANNVENLRKHILKTKKHEGLKQYVCKWCPYNTNSQYDFSHHLRNAHPGEDLGIRPTFVLGINRGVAKMKSVRSQDKLSQLAAASVVELEHDDTVCTEEQGTLSDMVSSQQK